MPLRLVEVRHPDSSDFLNSVEVEIENTGSRPIFAIAATIRFPSLVFPDSGKTYGIPLWYGREELVDIETRPQDSDAALTTGQHFVFRIPTLMQTGLHYFLANHHVDASLAKKMQFRVEEINFGDGTGYINGSFVDFRRPSVGSLETTGAPGTESAFVPVKLVAQRDLSCPPGCYARYKYVYGNMCNPPNACPKREAQQHTGSPCANVDYDSFSCPIPGGAIDCYYATIIGCDSGE